jgi:hypothetical protein
VEGADGTYGHGLHVDNNFTENWTGYTDAPSSNININIVGRGFNGNTVFVSGDNIHLQVNFEIFFFLISSAFVIILGCVAPTNRRSVVGCS